MTLRETVEGMCARGMELRFNGCMEPGGAATVVTGRARHRDGSLVEHQVIVSQAEPHAELALQTACGRVWQSLEEGLKR